MRKVLFAIVFLSVFSEIIAQETPAIIEEKPIYFEQPPEASFKDNLHYGGNLWLGFFGEFYADVSPMVGYQFAESGTIAGLGGTFIYQGNFDDQAFWVAGPRVFIRHPVWKSIFVHGEFELMNAPSGRFYSSPDGSISEGRKWEGSPLVGAGFYQGKGNLQGGSYIMVTYNLGYSYGQGFISPQGFGGNRSPWVIRFGFLF